MIMVPNNQKSELLNRWTNTRLFSPSRITTKQAISEFLQTRDAADIEKMTEITILAPAKGSMASVAFARGPQIIFDQRVEGLNPKEAQQVVAKHVAEALSTLEPNVAGCNAYLTRWGYPAVEAAPISRTGATA
jgi:hypothetical protein